MYQIEDYLFSPELTFNGATHVTVLCTSVFSNSSFYLSDSLIDYE